ncbi:MAG TPA: hypothetical protein VFD36_20455 [Kofleriaceae bacterium]|nr:hypothetical protein [Kofleriaceae bacterium]
MGGPLAASTPPTWAEPWDGIFPPIGYVEPIGWAPLAAELRGPNKGTVQLPAQVVDPNVMMFMLDGLRTRDVQ